MKNLNYFDPKYESLPLVKAKIAREIGMMENILYVTEIFIENIIEDLDPLEIAAFLSLFVCQVRKPRNQQVEEDYNNFDVPEKLKQAIQKAMAICDKIYNKEIEHELINTSI